MDGSDERACVRRRVAPLRPHTKDAARAVRCLQVCAYARRVVRHGDLECVRRRVARPLAREALHRVAADVHDNAALVAFEGFAAGRGDDRARQKEFAIDFLAERSHGSSVQIAINAEPQKGGSACYCSILAVFRRLHLSLNIGVDDVA